MIICSSKTNLLTSRYPASATEKYLHLTLSLLLIFSFSQMKSWTENSMRIANSLNAWPLLRVIRFYFGKSSVQMVFLELGSSYLIKLLETTRNASPLEQIRALESSQIN